jgi:hypothetical protein
MQHNTGVYKLVHRPTKQFYIGGTKNLYHRWASHKSHFKRGANQTKIQQVYDTTNNINDWIVEMLEPCAVRTLNKTEQRYLDKYIDDPKCLNDYSRVGRGRRNTRIKKVGRERLAVSLLGKNSKDGILRPNNLTFISPTGVHYKNILSVKRFAENHGLPQVAMNNLANGKSLSYMGWTRADNPLPKAASVQEYWSQERMSRTYPEYVIVGPDNRTLYKTFVISDFEKQYKCHVVKKLPNNKFGVKSHTKGLDSMGRGYRLANVEYYNVTYMGITYDNVISLGRWAQTMGIPTRKLRYYTSTQDQNVRRSKKSIKMTYTRITL